MAGVVEVTSRWIYVDRPEDPTPEFFRAHGTLRALSDLEDLGRADELVLDLTDGRGRRGGMMFEAGAAVALGKRFSLVGPADCVFTQLAEEYATWHDYVAAAHRANLARPTLICPGILPD